jgi:hypothetical protein
MNMFCVCMSVCVFEPITMSITSYPRYPLHTPTTYDTSTNTHTHSRTFSAVIKTLGVRGIGDTQVCSVVQCSVCVHLVYPNHVLRFYYTILHYTTLHCTFFLTTQCGFKLFSRRACQLICPNMHVERWVFDIEMLMLARTFEVQHFAHVCVCVLCRVIYGVMQCGV